MKSATLLAQDDAAARVGLHGTFYSGHERYPGTIVGIKTESGERVLAVQMDHYRSLGSGSRCLVWRNHAGRVLRFGWSRQYEAFICDEGVFVLGQWEAKLPEVR